MLLNDQLTALRAKNACDFERSDVCGGAVLVVFPDGRRNLLPYSPISIQYGSRWTNVPADLRRLSELTRDDSIATAQALHDRLTRAVPGVVVEVDSFTRGTDRPIRFNASLGGVSVRGGFPIDMEQVDAEARRIADGFAAARAVVEAEISTWRRTTIDACGVAISAALCGLDGAAFFERLERAPSDVKGTVDEKGVATTSTRTHKAAFGETLVVRVTGRTATTTAKTPEYTFDGNRLIVKNARRVPEAMLATLKGRALDQLVSIPGLDGSELIIKRVKAENTAKRSTMTVQLKPRPLRMDAARELYDRIRAKNNRIEERPEGRGDEA